jgi:hypothetical protein
MSHKVVFIDSKRIAPGDYTMSHSDDNVEAFFHAMYANGKLGDEHMARIAERMPGFRLPEACEKTSPTGRLHSPPRRRV